MCRNIVKYYLSVFRALPRSDGEYHRPMTEADRDLLPGFLISEENLMNPAVIVAVEYVSCEPTACARELFDEDAEPEE